MPAYVYVIISITWITWFAAFLSRKQARVARQIKKQARWGILLEFIGFMLIWQGRFWESSPGWKLIPGALLLILAIVLSWTGVTALGANWRIDAGLNPHHELIRSGPYAFIRHPIYASMLCLLLGTGLLLTPWWLLVPALAIFLAGTEIRIRIEDGLLASEFGPEFEAYKRSVPAYVPWLR